MSTARNKEPEDVVITHPNRETASAKTTRAFVIGLLAAACALTFILVVGASGHQTGALGLQVLCGLLFGYFAYLVAQWRSGVLPVAAGLALISGVFAAVSISGWFDRDGTGFESTPIPADLIGVLLFGYAVLCFVTTFVCMRAFTQQWQVEVEVPRDQYRGGVATA